jgi:hypothetical protein
MENERPLNTSNSAGGSLYRWVRLASLNIRRAGSVARFLEDGRVLVRGCTYYDADNRKVFAPPEVWDPATDTWSVDLHFDKVYGKSLSQPNYSQPPVYGRKFATLTPLEEGRVLMTGGYADGYGCGPFEVSGSSDNTAVVVDTSTGNQTPAGTLCVPRHLHAAIRFPSGAVMLIGGEQGEHQSIKDVEVGLPGGVDLAGIAAPVRE